MKLLMLAWLWFECLVKEIFRPLAGGIIFGRLAVWATPNLPLFEGKTHLSVWGYLLAVAFWTQVLRWDWRRRPRYQNSSSSLSFAIPMAVIIFFTTGFEQNLATVCGVVLIIHYSVIYIARAVWGEEISTKLEEPSRV